MSMSTATTMIETPGRQKKRRWMLRQASTAVLLCSACSVRSARDFAPAGQGRDQNTPSAQRLNALGLEAIEKGDLNEAEDCFRKANACDLYYAPAHNNLGLVLLRKKAYYEAAWEFEYAARLAPASPEPRDNLGLLYEHIGRLDQAAAEYEAALAIAPDNLATMQNLARAYVKADRRDDRLRQVLEKILLQPPSNPQWDVWARGQLVRLGRPDPVDPAPQPFTTR
jgi:Flp pilus assembly protein TadD